MKKLKFCGFDDWKFEEKSGDGRRRNFRERRKKEIL